MFWKSRAIKPDNKQSERPVMTPPPKGIPQSPSNRTDEDKTHYFKLFVPGDCGSGWSFEDHTPWEGIRYMNKRRTAYIKREEVEAAILAGLPPGAKYRFQVIETYLGGSYQHERPYMGHPIHEGQVPVETCEGRENENNRI